jgi:hypothetical protein
VHAEGLKMAAETTSGLQPVRRSFARHPLGALARRKRGERRGAAPSTPKEAVLVSPSGQVVCERCHVIDCSLPRIRGHIGWQAPARGEGILICSSSPIRAAFARDSIDAVFLDEELTVLAITERLRPWRVAWKRRADSVLELPAGRCETLGLRPGDKLAWGWV